MAFLFRVYVYVGTYIFPIAPYWVTQLPPNPTRPQITHGEFNFRIKYSVDGNVKEVKDDIICEFSGFKVYAMGGPKKRVYTETFKVLSPFFFRDEKDDLCTDVCIEEFENYKVILTVPHAGWFLNDPDYSIAPSSEKSAYLRVYDIQTKYYLYPEEAQKLFEEKNFEVIEWYYDKPVKNNFK